MPLERFSICVDRNFAFVLVLLYYYWMAKLAPFFQQMGSQTKTNRASLARAFSRAWHRLHVFASSSDWLIVLFRFVVTGQRNDFGFGFTTLE